MVRQLDDAAEPDVPRHKLADLTETETSICAAWDSRGNIDEAVQSAVSAAMRVLYPDDAGAAKRAEDITADALERAVSPYVLCMSLRESFPKFGEA